MKLYLDRNAEIMAWRHENRIAELELMHDVNRDWFARAWDTPDVAMCLGRYKSSKQARKHARKLSLSSQMFAGIDWDAE